MNLNNIEHHVTTKESIKKYPGIAYWKECWSLKEKEYDHDAGSIVAAISHENKYEYYPEYKSLKQEYRKQKLQKIQKV